MRRTTMTRREGRGEVGGQGVGGGRGEGLVGVGVRDGEVDGGRGWWWWQGKNQHGSNTS